jgi:hypothetical protein
VPGEESVKGIIRTALIAGAALAGFPAVAAAAGNGSGGVTGPGIYVDGELFRTVGTPTDLSLTGAPDGAFDTIYTIDGHNSVATAAPGDRDFNGGRWRVHALAVNDYEAAVAAVDLNGSGDIDSDGEVDAAIAAGLADDTGIVRSFECPLIAVPRR